MAAALTHAHSLLSVGYAASSVKMSEMTVKRPRDHMYFVCDDSRFRCYVKKGNHVTIYYVTLN